MDYDEIPSMLQHYRFKRKMIDNLNQINDPSKIPFLYVPSNHFSPVS